jgi:hypothetical protein
MVAGGKTEREREREREREEKRQMPFIDTPSVIFFLQEDPAS